MQIKLNIFVCLLFISPFVFSQSADTTESKYDYFRKRVYMMGGFGMSFGNVTFVNVAPVIAYRFTPKIHGGFGVSYVYYRNNLFNYSTNIYGGSIFGRYFILENLFAHTEYERLFLKWSDGNSYDLTNIYVGGGYNQRLGGRVFANILVLYNINQSPYSPYGNPIFRMGIGMGF